MKVLLKIKLLLFFTTLSLFVRAEKNEVVYEHFRSSRLINLHTVEVKQTGFLELRISHRFGSVNGGINQFFGLDQATMRLGLEYGIARNFMIGIGRSTYEKTVDGFLKWKVLNQKKNGTPFSMALLAVTNMNGLPRSTIRDDFFSSRLTYIGQLILARKFNDFLTLQLSPTIVHRNLVAYTTDKNQTYSVGAAAKYNLSKSISLNTEYIYRIQNGVTSTTFTNYNNSFSVGLGFDTRGHFFEFHITNSMPMNERGFIEETTDSWQDGSIHFGFNIIRDFNISKKR